MSRFGATEPFIESLLAPLVADGTISEAKVVADKGLLAETTGPVSVMICSNAPTQVGSDDGGDSHSIVEYEQMTMVLIRVKTDGQNIGEGKQQAWALWDKIFVDTIQNNTPTGAPDGTTYWPLFPGNPFETIPVAGEFGVGAEVKGKIMWVK
jgi:hypothetical protein